jgi:hypothetical protein
MAAPRASAERRPALVGSRQWPPTPAAAGGLLLLQRAVGNQAVGQLLQRVRLPVGGVIVETDYYSTEILEQGMKYGVRGTPKANKDELPALEKEIRARTQRGQYAAPGLAKKRLAPQQADFDATMRRNAASRERLRALVAEGLRSTDPLLRNSCEWVRQGRIKLYAASDLEDTADRFMAGVNHDPKQYLTFRGYSLLYPDPEKNPAGDIYSEPVPYDWEAPYDEAGFERLMSNVSLELAGTRGTYRQGRVVIMVERLGSRDELIQFFTSTVKHEVQHAADLHEAETEQLGPRSAQNLLQHAKLDFDTEYRAHAIMGHPDVLKAGPQKKEPFLYDKDRTVTQRHNVLTRIAWKDIAFKYEKPEEVTASTPPFLATDQMQALFAYMATADPMATAVNLINSVRVDGFYRALATRSYKRVADAYLDLDSSDRAYLKDDPAAVGKVGTLIGAGIGDWGSAPALWSDLERVGQVVSAAFGQAQMYGWSRSYLLKAALEGSLDDLLKPASTLQGGSAYQHLG